MKIIYIPDLPLIWRFFLAQSSLSFLGFEIFIKSLPSKTCWDILYFQELTSKDTF